MSPAAGKIIKKLLDSAELRRQAENRLSLAHAADEPQRTELDTQRLVHELQVHQIELEMQNEELQCTRAEVEAGLQQYTDLYDFAPVGYFTLARDTTIIQANLKGASLLGMERAYLVGRPFNLFVATADLLFFHTFLKKVFESQAKEACEVGLNRIENPSSPQTVRRSAKDGTVKRMVRIEAESAEDGQTCRTIMIDISALKRAEEELRLLNAGLELRVKERTSELLSTNYQLSYEIKQRLEVLDKLKEEHNLISAILDTASALIVVLDHADRIVIFNQFCENLTGYNAQDVKGKILFDLNFIPADELETFREHYIRFKNTSDASLSYFENAWIGRGGIKHLVGWSAAEIRGIKGEMAFMVFLGLDLTENRSLRESLRTSEEKYGELFLNLPISTLEVAYENDHLMVVNANYQALRTYGDLINLHPASFLGNIFALERKKDIEIIKKQSNRMARMAFESIHICANGETFPVRITISFESELPSSHYILMIEDITAEKKRRSEEIAISEERARLAREIHDGIAQDLVTITMRAYFWRKLIEKAPQKLNAEIDFLQNTLNKDIQEVRRSIFALRPLALEEGFFPAITRHIKDFGELNRITTHLWLDDGLPNLNEELELSMFRMIQESLNNIAKHARANNIWVNIKIDPDKSFTIEIRDDGVGFNMQDLKTRLQPGHFGLSQMQERVREHHGKFEIASEENKGVSIQINLPIREKVL